MALAVGTLKNVTAAELTNMDQQQAERRCERMHLLGLLVLSNHLHHASKDTIGKLHNRSGSLCLGTVLFAVLMCTIMARLHVMACGLIGTIVASMHVMACELIQSWMLHC